MENSRPFLILRYSLIQEAQGALQIKSLPDPKGRAILVSLVGDREFFSNSVKYGFIGFSITSPTNQGQFPSDRFVIGKTAKLRHTHVGEKIPGDIIEHKADDWIPLITIVDLLEQYIFIQKDWRFGTDEQILKAVQSGMRPPVLSEFNHRVFVEPKTRKERFWTVVRSRRKIYKLQLKMISPNILETNKKAKEALAALKNLFGQDETSITLESEAGDLHVPENPIADYVDYIAEGEGNWKLTTAGDHGGKKTFSSAECTEIIELNIEVDEALPEGAQMEPSINNRVAGRLGDESRLVADVYDAIVNRLSR